MEWKDLTVGQFLDLHRLAITADVDDITKAQRAVCILYGLSERQVDDMLISEFNQKSSEAVRFLTKDIPGKAVRRMRVGKNVYSIQYNPKKLTHRQYVEIISFGEKPIENMHYIMASLVEKVKWGTKRKNKAEEHERIANDLLSAKVVDVYHSCVFFCNLYVNSITRIKDYLVQETTKKNPKITVTQANELLQLSVDVMAGFIPQKNSLTL
jgi:hypothetical protein